MTTGLTAETFVTTASAGVTGGGRPLVSGLTIKLPSTTVPGASFVSIQLPGHPLNRQFVNDRNREQQFVTMNRNREQKTDSLGQMFTHSQNTSVWIRMTVQTESLRKDSETPALLGGPPVRTEGAPLLAGPIRMCSTPSEAANATIHGGEKNQKKKKKKN